ncbi:MAG: DUF3843 family protein [Bacteroidales bacterium]|nr:DUF3843 family protein [Bacteroidales bacterium]
MKIKKIYPKDWLDYKPYAIADEVDRYYSTLANKVQNMLASSPWSKEFTDALMLQQEAIVITCWFEDICSNIGIWRVVNDECLKRYGSRLPFYDMESYYPGEVNVQDLQLLLWDFLQSVNDRGTLINPENPYIHELATQLADLFESEFEYAPENERLHSFVHNPEIATDWMQFRAWLMWFEFNSYLTCDSRDQLEDQIYQMSKEGINNPEVTYSLSVDMSFREQSNLLSLNPVRWCSRITGIESLEKVDRVVARYLLYHDHDGNVIEVTDICSGESYNVMVENNLYDKFLNTCEPEKSVLSMDLATDGQKWYLTGIMFVIGNITDRKIKERVDQYKENQEILREHKQTYDAMLKRNNGSPLLFLKDSDEAKKAYKKYFDFDDASLKQLPPQFFSAKNMMVFADPRKGICFSPGAAELIAHPDNPLYDRKTADAKGISIYAKTDFLPYFLACDFHDSGYFKDARINSVKGEEYGREFVRKHGAYLLDYFYAFTREYDKDKS